MTLLELLARMTPGYYSSRRVGALLDLLLHGCWRRPLINYVV